MTFEQHFITTADGLKLGFRDYQTADAGDLRCMPVVCLPGLTRNAKDFHQLALRLAADKERPRRVIAVDYRGRGTSDWAEDKTSYNVVQECLDLLLILNQLSIARAAFIGTSRGGLILHILAGLRPDIIGSVIFNDVGPELGLEGLKQIQRYLGARPDIGSFEDTVRHVKFIHGDMFTLLEDTDWRDYATATYRESDGSWGADCDPAIAESFASMALDGPLPDLWEKFDTFPDVPLMVIRGENSELLTPAIVDEMHRRRPGLLTVEARGQGHAPVLHLDDLPQRIAAFLLPVE
ncbi:alpha/beta fold hydrolase [Rhizobium oryzicola]|uniref:Alpha/beta hydrolase n=1 Tax=Rhizobium oryzicola TaxID=1232668 RepID=A0ABT8SV81_9HYPH|nr:alpha/beta hydrolase [Rhizobium oryzicola]MDO1581617.1 alpha/beta hydrolase [Rhizobium oryzicola]